MSEDRVLAGMYKGRVVANSQQYAINPKTGTEQIAIDIDIPVLGRSFTTFLYFSEAAATYALDRLRACGWTGDDLTNLDGIDANEVDVSIRYETFEGKERMKVEIFSGGGRVKLENQMDEKQKRAFAARMKSVIKGTPGNSAPARTHAPPATRHSSGAYDPGPPDDGIPF